MYFKYKGPDSLKSNEWGKTTHANIKYKNVVLVILISDQTDSYTIKIIRYKEGYSIMTKCQFTRKKKKS